MDNINKENVLTDIEKDQIMSIMNEEVEKSENLRVLRDLPSNNGVEESTNNDDGYEKMVNVSINPVTGEKSVLGEVDEITCVDDFDNESAEDFIKRIEASDATPDFDVTVEDVKNTVADTTNSVGGFDISDETALELLKIINKMKNTTGGVDVKYKDLPEEVRQYIDLHLRKEGIIDCSVQSNTIRNFTAQQLMNEYFFNIGAMKITDDFNNQLEEMYKKSEEELSPMFKDYNDNKLEYLREISKTIEDEDKKAAVEKVIDSIKDAGELTRVKEYQGKIKIKNYYFEDPTRIYDEIHNKYKSNNYHIYDLSMCESVVYRHLVKNDLIEKEDSVTARTLMLAFALFCRNYDIKKPENHAFMYYFTYNIILLDMYKEQQYEEFAKTFLMNLLEFKNIIR